MPLTDSQKQAVETLDKNVSISAGAGSGKTRVLVERFCEIVRLKKAEADEILTLTFTEKAAKEMKTRITERFEELYQNDPDPWLSEQRRKVESAYIGTIHSFASRILRENAFDAYLDPNFVILADPQARMLQQQVIEDLISEKYESGQPEYVELVTDFEATDGVSSAFHENYGNSSRPKGIAESILDLYHHAHGLGLDVSKIQIAEDVLKLSEKEKEEIYNEYIISANDYIDALKQGTAAVQKKAGEFQIVFENSKPVIQKYLHIDGINNSFDWHEFDPAEQALKYGFGSTGKKELRDSVKETGSRIYKAILSFLSIKICGYFKQAAIDFEEKYWESKRLLGALDYDDILFFTKRLLLNPDGTRTSVAKKYQRKFKYVVMDEFQDSNTLQKSIVTSVCRENNFFTVGDVKQSIYSFINSDVSVFQSHHAQMKKKGSCALSFQENFRSHPKVIQFVNQLFGSLWKETDFPFESLSAEGKFQPSDDAGVELMLIPNAENSADGQLKEARAVANRINQLLGRNGHERFKISRIKEEGIPARDLEPKDIMILFRSIQKSAVYEQALREAGIDYYVVGGSGFYESHEVQDLLNLLRIVDNPLDDVAMAGILRSPLVGVSENALYWMTRVYTSPKDTDKTKTDEEEADVPVKNRYIGKLYSSLLKLPEIQFLSEEDREKLATFRSLLDELHSMRSDTDLSVLIDTALNAANYELSVLASSDGKRGYANIVKFKEIIQDFQSSGFYTLSDLVHHFEELSIYDNRQEEAQTETENSQVVRLMTIHQAKGLEAPVVFIAGCSTQSNSSRSDLIVMNKDFGFSSKLKNPNTGHYEKVASYENIHNSNQNADSREEERILYVAATRAEELLVLCDYKGNPKISNLYKALKYQANGIWSGMIEKEIGLSDTYQVLNNGYPIRLNWADTEDWNPTESSETAAAKYGEEIASGSLIPVSEKMDISEILARCQEDHPAQSTKTIHFTVSSVLDYLTSPKQYYRRWILGIDDEFKWHPAKDKNHKTESSSAELGLAVHDLLSKINLSEDYEEQLRKVSGDLDESVRDRVITQCRKFLKSEWLSQAKESSSVMREVPFTVKCDGFTLTGRIDLLYKDPEDNWVIVDYKTGGLESHLRYDQQVGLYALGVQKCLNTTPAKVVLLNPEEEASYCREVDSSLIGVTQEVLDDAAKGIRGWVNGKPIN